MGVIDLVDPEGGLEDVRRRTLLALAHLVSGLGHEVQGFKFEF